MLEDTLLIWKFKHGSRDALGRIYAKYRHELLKLAVCLANDVGIAEDAVAVNHLVDPQHALRIAMARQ